MKKMISGYFFRLVRSYEIIAVLILFAIASVYVTSMMLNFDPSIKLIRTNDGYYGGRDHSVYIDEGNVKQYMFESLGASAYDVARCHSEPIPQDVYDKIAGPDSYNSAYFEYRALMYVLFYLHLLPTIVIVLIIPMFLGKLFSDGTVKNLVACGHTKIKIYLSAIIFAFILDALMILFNLLVFACYCIYYEWKPPVYIPVALTVILISLLLTFTVTTVAVSVLFASRNRVISAIAGFLMLVFIFVPNNIVLDLYKNNDYQPEPSEWEEYDRIIEEYGPNVFEMRVDITELVTRTYYNGKEIIPSGNTLPAPARAALVTICYLDPVLCKRENNAGGEYLAYRSGFYSINAACNVLWILVAGASGIRIFKKHELT